MRDPLKSPRLRALLRTCEARGWQCGVVEVALMPKMDGERSTQAYQIDATAPGVNSVQIRSAFPLKALRGAMATLTKSVPH